MDVAHAGEAEPPKTAEGGLLPVGNPALSGDFRYTLNQPVWHDASCPGSYIMGRVIDRNGAPVAGVHVVLFDQWGNRYDAVSKNGPADYGQFDFPIFSGTPQTLRLVVVDANGQPISPEIPVPHNMDEVSSKPCHHVTFVGG
ncbi:MAG: carboxypeptidase regulatory-like domain-containing protein [Caldilineae bacterium]|nr:MAG: carboxypeptidase regulatory-like domain-containing protein [Caldilineae bacterium]